MANENETHEGLLHLLRKVYTEAKGGRISSLAIAVADQPGGLFVPSYVNCAVGDTAQVAMLFTQAANIQYQRQVAIGDGPEDATQDIDDEMDISEAVEQAIKEEPLTKKTTTKPRSRKTK